MEEKKKKEKRDGLYRLVVFSEHTFEEVRSFTYRSWYLWAAVGGLAFLILLIVFGILSLKPLKSYMTQGYAFVDSEELISLRQKIIELEHSASAQQMYINNLRRLLSGEVIPETDSAHINAVTDSLSLIERIREDDQLRQYVKLEDQLNLIENSKSEAIVQPKSLEQLFLVPPLTGAVSLSFDPVRNHLGVDINAPSNTPIKSVLDGHIIYAGWTLETGNTVGIQHDNNIITFYKHNSALLKQTGSLVRAGEAVAIIGNTGTLSSGPHLHFELWLNGSPVNPANYINFE